MLLTKSRDITQNKTTSLVVIAPNVEAPEQLIAGVKANAKVILLDPNKDSIAQITTALATGNYHRLHLISHGSPGCLHLANTDLNSATIAQYKQQIIEWGIAEIAIYGCNVAAKPELLEQLQALTGANIAASRKEVGSGNWTLEWQLGEVTGESVLETELRQKYRGKFVGFKPQTTFAAGDVPTSVAIGDLDGDGAADDLAVANESSDNVSLLLADGSGGFSPQTTFAAGNGPISVAIGDLDGDGAADDLAVVNRNSDNVSLLLADGSGGFSPQTTFAAGDGSISVAIGDLDGDGAADDLAVANERSDNVSLLLGDGSGGFSPQTTFTAGDAPDSVAIGDLDGDGAADDLATANVNSDNVSLLLGDGSGGFSPQTTFAVGDRPYSVAIGDLDGDGAADDLAVANATDDNVSLLLADGSGGFSPQTTFAAGDAPRSVAIGDLDGDGAADDLAVANRIDDNVSVLLGDGSGGFSPQTTFAAGDFPFSLAIGDLDGDGAADDLATANVSSDNVSVLIECFLTGTHVLTQGGKIAVENLQIGDLVHTADGQLEPVKWIGRQTIEPGSIKNTLRGNPVLVKAGALGNSLPTKDLYLSPDHSLFVDGLLINAGALVNDISIIKTEPTEAFVYHSIELANHALLTVEGTLAESYMPHHEDRANYDNGAEYEELYPHGSNLMLWPMDYPRVSSRTQVPRFVSQKLLAIAYQLLHTTSEMSA